MREGIYYEDVAESRAAVMWEMLNLIHPLNVRELLEELGFEYAKLYTLPQRVIGSYTWFPDMPPLVTVNGFLDPTRQTFAIAHEIGHHEFLDDRSRAMVFYDLDVKRESRLEKQCDRFAAALLMPHWIVREMHVELSSNPGKRVSIMAKRFGVSYSAMLYRLYDLKLEEKGYHRRQ